MSEKNLEVRPANKSGFVMSLDGDLMGIPDSWKLLPPGDAALSRRIKKDGASWTIKEKKGVADDPPYRWLPAQNISQEVIGT